MIVIQFNKNAGSLSSIRISSTPDFNNTYGYNKSIDVEATFSETVTVTGSPRIPVLGLSSKYFTYFSGSGSNILIFRYTTVSLDSATAGVGITANTLDLNSGTIKDSGGIAATINHVAVAISSSHRVDVIAPVVSTSTSITIDENTTNVATLVANETVSWSLLNNNEYAFFALNSSTGVLTISARDFENPQDAAPYNTYVVRVRAGDLGGNIKDTIFVITINNVVETATINQPTLSGGAVKGRPVTISVVANNAGKVQFYANGKKIPKCTSVTTSGSAPNVSATCSWIPAVMTRTFITARITPADGNTLASISVPLSVQVTKRSNTR